MKMKKRWLLVAMLAHVCASAGLAADPTITVLARQRYPWNGLVDINFTITGTSGTKYDTSFTAKDMVGNTNIAMRTIRKTDGTAAAAKEQLQPGTYSWVWDAAADLPKDFQCDRVTVSGSAAEHKYLYMVIDLSSGSSSSKYPVSYLDAAPSGGFNVNAYKTTKLVLRRCEAGTFKMQNSKNVTLTKAFFCGLFEVTQKQYKLVTGASPSNFSGDTLPVESVSYNSIRGSSNGAKWPSSSAVDSSSFMGKLRARTGLDFDLPTEAQWEYACRAGTTTTYSYGNSADGNYMWYSSNSNSQPHPVGSKRANPWGLYDMHGNVWEWSLDWFGTLAYGTDPKGSSSGSYRVLRGGSWYIADEKRCTSSFRDGDTPSGENNSRHKGFRLVRTLSN